MITKNIENLTTSATFTTPSTTTTKKIIRKFALVRLYANLRIFYAFWTSFEITLKIHQKCKISFRTMYLIRQKFDVFTDLP